jgi:hypothetical protein
VIQLFCVTPVKNPPVLASVQYIQALGKKFFAQDTSIWATGEGLTGKSFIPKHPFIQQLIHACVRLKVHVTSDYHRPVCGTPIPARGASSE